MCIALSTIVAHNTEQNRPDNFLSCLQTIILAPMMSLRGKALIEKCSLPEKVERKWRKELVNPGSPGKRLSTGDGGGEPVQTMNTETHTQLFYGPFSGTIWVSRCQK